MAEDRRLDALGPDDAYRREMKPYETYRVGNSEVELVRRLVNGKGEGRTLLPKAHYKKEFLEKNGWEEVYALRISHLDSTGEVIIPQHYGNFGLLVDLFRRDDPRTTDMMSAILSNMDIALQMPLYGELGGFLAVVFNAILNKSLNVGEKKKLYGQFKDTFADYLDKDLLMYEKEPEPEDMSEKEYHQAEVADEARQELNRE